MARLPVVAIFLGVLPQLWFLIDRHFWTPVLQRVVQDISDFIQLYRLIATVISNDRLKAVSKALDQIVGPVSDWVIKTPWTNWAQGKLTEAVLFSVNAYFQHLSQGSAVCNNGLKDPRGFASLVMHVIIAITPAYLLLCGLMIIFSFITRLPHMAGCAFLNLFRKRSSTPASNRIGNHFQRSHIPQRFTSASVTSPSSSRRNVNTHNPQAIQALQPPATSVFQPFGDRQDPIFKVLREIESLRNVRRGISEVRGPDGRNPALDEIDELLVSKRETLTRLRREQITDNA